MYSSYCFRIPYYISPFIDEVVRAPYLAVRIRICRLYISQIAGSSVQQLSSVVHPLTLCISSTVIDPELLTCRSSLRFVKCHCFSLFICCSVCVCVRARLTVCVSEPLWECRCVSANSGPASSRTLFSLLCSRI